MTQPDQPGPLDRRAAQADENVAREGTGQPQAQPSSAKEITLISADPKQLAELLSALRAHPKPKWNSESVLNFLQAAALIAGACWALFEFLSYEHEAKVIGKETARLTYETQQSQRELRFKELEYTVRQKQLEIELSELKNKEEHHQVEFKTSYRFAHSNALSVERLEDLPGGQGLFDATFSLSILNQSEEPFEISMLIIDCYMSDLSSQFSSEASNGCVLPFGEPPDRWNPSGSIAGATAYKLIGSWGAIYAEAKGKITPPWDYVTKEVDMVSGGVGVQVCKPGQEMHFTKNYLVRAKDGSYLCFVASLCFNRGAKNEDLWSIYHDLHLPVASKSATGTNVRGKRGV